MVHNLSHGLFGETDEDNENSQFLNKTSIPLEVRAEPWVKVPRTYSILKFIFSYLKLGSVILTDYGILHLSYEIWE